MPNFDQQLNTTKYMINNTNILYLALLFIALLQTNCQKNEVIINNVEDYEAYLMEEVEAQNIPALSVLLFKEDHILYENYLGQAQIDPPIPLESDHLFLLASVSKVVTATALLQLEEAGRFALTDNINDYLPFEVNIPNYNTPITFQMLLTHTSAIADGSSVDEAYYYGEDSPVALAHFLEQYLVPNGDFYDEVENFYDFEPGREHEYTNMGNALIGVLVEEISGMDFDAYCQQNIFQPLNMTNTSWRLEPIQQTIVQPYEYVRGEFEAVEHYTFTDYPNGGLRSTGRDLFQFLRAFVQDGRSNGYQLLQSGTIQNMLSPQIPSIDEEVGLHLFVMNDEYQLWGHDGGEQGVATIVAFHPTTKIGAIILTNQEEADVEDLLVKTYELGLTY